MKTKRPVNFDIGTIKLPITSYVSILHRVSGVILFLAVALMLWVLDMSLSSEQSFISLKECLSSPIAQFVIWAALATLAYHIVAGIRHLAARENQMYVVATTGIISGKSLMKGMVTPYPDPDEI